jgi:hypothetical protein
MHMVSNDLRPSQVKVDLIPTLLNKLITITMFLPYVDTVVP